MKNNVSRNFDLDSLDPDARELMPLFVSTRRADLTELQAAMKAGKLEVAAGVGHRIRGTAQTYGLAELGELGVELEQAAKRGDVAEVERCVAGVAGWVEWLEETVGAETS